LKLILENGVGKGLLQPGRDHQRVAEPKYGPKHERAGQDERDTNARPAAAGRIEKYEPGRSSTMRIGGGVGHVRGKLAPNRRSTEGKIQAGNVIRPGRHPAARACAGWLTASPRRTRNRAQVLPRCTRRQSGRSGQTAPGKEKPPTGT